MTPDDRYTYELLIASTFKVQRLLRHISSLLLLPQPFYAVGARGASSGRRNRIVNESGRPEYILEPLEGVALALVAFVMRKELVPRRINGVERTSLGRYLGRPRNQTERALCIGEPGT